MDRRNESYQGPEGHEHIQIEDVLCLRCGVQGTVNSDHVCGLCKAIGKTSESDIPSSGRSGETTTQSAASSAVTRTHCHVLVFPTAGRRSPGG